MFVRLALIAWIGGLLGCKVPDVDLDGKACPCVDGYACDTVTNTCVRTLPDDAAIDGAVPVTPNTLASRGNFMCTLRSNGAVWCWGLNTGAELGRGFVSASEAPAPTALPTIVRIDAGELAMYAIDTTGRVWGWGGNPDGQLAMPASAVVTTPRELAIPEPVASIAGGENHACALATSGNVYCWGRARCGQLGDGGGTGIRTPVQVPGLSGVVQLAAHDSLTCARDSAGGVTCWGAVIDSGGSCMGQALTPTAVGLPPIAWLTGGCHLTACAADTAGDAYCWGENQSGNIGDGMSLDRLVPSKVQLPVGTRVKRIGTGVNSTCAATTDDRILCWGTNASGQLGIGAAIPTSSLVPRESQGFGAFPIDDLEVACGHACVRSGGAIHCWGSNGVRELGNGTTTDGYVPSLVVGLPP